MLSNVRRYGLKKGLLAAGVLLLSSCASMGGQSRPVASSGLSYPAPTEAGWMDIETEKRSNRDRKAWFEEMHKAPPGVDWRKIENANGEAQRIKRNKLREKHRGVEPRGMSTTTGSGTGMALTTAAAVADANRWTERGSNNQAGRVHVAAHSPNGSYLYVGSAMSGVWRGDLDGQSWAPLSDNLYSGAHSLAVIPGATASDPDVIVRGTDAGLVHVTRDMGATWTVPAGLLNPPPQWSEVQRIAVARDNTTILLVMSFWSGANYSTKVYRSTDRAQSFVQVLDMGIGKGDLWVPRTGLGNIFSVANNTVRRSSDNGATWSSNGLGTLPVSATDIGLTGSEAGAPRLWVIAAAGGTRNLYRSDDAGVTWSYKGAITDYWDNRSLSASTVNADLFAYGGMEMWRSVDGGTSFTKVNDWGKYYPTSHVPINPQAPNIYLHADIPGIDVIPCAINASTCPSGELWYISTDGGLYRSRDGVASVQNLSLSGLRISQYYGTHTSTLDPNRIAAGSQDQGYQYHNGTTSPPQTLLSFNQLYLGDYGRVVSGDGTHQYVYSVAPGSVYVGIGETDPPYWKIADLPPGGSGEAMAWLPVIAADPLDITSFFVAGEKIYRYTKDASANTWSYVQWGGLNVDLSNDNSEYISALTFSPLDHNLAFAATTKGRVFYSSDKGVTWTQSSTAGPAPHYTYGHALLASGKNAQTVYIGGGGYGGSIGIQRSNDGGQSFQAYNQGLPETMTYSLCEAPNGSGTLFAGTETAAYRRDPGATAWVDVSGVEAPVNVYYSCEAVRDNQIIRTGTYGRGIWDYQMASDLSSTISVSQTGATATVTATVTNNGPDIQGNVVVNLSGDLPTGQAQLPLPPGCSITGTVTITCILGDLAVSQVTIAITYNLAGRSTPFTMQAQVTTTSSINDPNGSNNVSSTTFTPSAADLSATLSGAQTSGTMATFTATVTNRGPNIQGNAVVNVWGDLPGSQAILPSNCSGTGTVTCSLGTLAVGQIVSVAIPYDLAGRTSVVTMRAQAEAIPSLNDPDGSNNYPTTTLTPLRNTGWLNPTANAAKTSSAGDNNGYQTNPTYAYADDTLSALDTDSGSGTSPFCNSSEKDVHRFSSYNVSVPTGATIKGIEVRLDAKVDSTSGSPKICVKLSWDAGVSWTTAKATPTLSTTMATYTLGSWTDTWGRTWSVNNFTNTNFRVRVIDVSSSTSRDFRLDWVPVRVYYWP